jgi:hypothetical protein
MVPALLLRGLLVGLVAGLLAFGFAKLFGEPLVDQAIAFEAQQHAGHEEGPELVSRSVQAGVGLLIASLGYASALGGIFSLVFAYWNGRTRLTARGTAALLALLGFVAVSLVPAIIYPANPPAVGNHDTIGMRTALFFGALLISIAVMALAVAVGRTIRARSSLWNACVTAGLSYVVLMFVAQALLPGVHEVPAGFSAELLWQFRAASLGVQIVIWATLGLVFGPVAERMLQPRTARHLKSA